MPPWAPPVTPPVAAEVDMFGLTPTRAVAFTGDGQAVSLPPPGQTLTLGRDSKNSLVFAQGDVSRRHAEITEKDGSYYLRDLKSSNGTFLNQQALEPGKWVEFRPGDELRLGSQASLNRSPHDLPEELPKLPLPANGSSLTVGRAPDNQLLLPWAQASRSHALIRAKGGQNWIMDQGSLNGTFLNGKKIPSHQWVVLQPGNTVQFGISPQAAFAVAAPGQSRAALKTGLTTLSPEASQAILDRAQFAPNPTGVRAMGAPDCTPEFLKAHGLEPKMTFHCGSQKVHFSQPYRLGDNRAACVGYVEDSQGQVRVRALYRSNSQGLWRSASHAGMGGWIGKGVGEESTNLPIAMQAALHQQTENALKEVDQPTAHQAFYGCLEFAGHKAPQELRDQLQEPAKLGHFQAQLGDGHGQPESYTLENPTDGPDFAHIEFHYTFQHPIHGEVKADGYGAQNGIYQYTFYRDQQDRSWLAQVEQVSSPLTTWGTRAQPVELGDLAMPAIEYRQQIPAGYAGAQITGSYADASGFVHKLPLVADYRNSLGLGLS